MTDSSNERGRRGGVAARLERSGVPERYERLFDLVLAVLVAAFAAGWSFAMLRAQRLGEPTPRVTTVVASPLSPSAPPPAVFLLDAAIRQLVSTSEYTGESGDVHVLIEGETELALPDSVAAEVRLGYREYGDPGGADTTGLHTAPAEPSVWNVLVSMRGAVRPVPGLSLITLVPLSEKRGGRIGDYRVGDWPFERGGRPPTPAYEPPTGLVKVTPGNQDLAVSRHFRLRDFLTKGQEDVWPKYVVLSTRLLDKLELTIDELEEMGHPVRGVGVISGFRTPAYNEGGGDPSGRGALSRHMYGDAMDFFIDNDGDARMDDLNGDGRIDTGDGRVMIEAAERVERKYPHLVGGIGLYAPSPGAHSGFVHIDTRGYRARW